MASSTVLLALGFVIGSSVDQHFELLDMDVLAGKMKLTRHAMLMVKNKNDLDRLDQHFGDSLIGHHGLEVMVVDAAQSVIFATPNAKFSPQKVIDSARKDPENSSLWRQGPEAYRVIAAELDTSLPPYPAVDDIKTGAFQKVYVAIAVDMAPHHAFMGAFLKTLWFFVVGAAILTGLLGWAVVRAVLAPLRAMREQAKDVTAQQLSHRLAVETVPYEMAELATSLNDMLERLEVAFRRLSDFSSDIAHELRTPLSNLLTQTQVALSRVRNADEYRSILESNAEELEHMARMISDMLLLAKAHNDFVVPSREIVNLGEEIQTLFDYYEAVAEEKGLQLLREGEGEIGADRLMLRRALGNLLSNAVRHATANTSIRVRINVNIESVSIAMENMGDPIGEEYLERVFDRFFRIDPSRQRSTEGTGLGLAITKSIVTAHGGKIAARSVGNLTTFTITLPRNADQAERGD
jgi:two-component system heavy metal sensor histidine kinase CusS